MNYDRLFENDCVYKLQMKDVEALKTYLNKKQGWVYIAYSKNNSLLKIGRTSKNPLQRARTLSTTGVLHDYEILFALKVFNQFWVEKKVHQKLKKFRISKEFFSVKEDKAILTLEEVLQEQEQLLKRFFNLEMVQEDIDLLEHALY